MLARFENACTRDLQRKMLVKCTRQQGNKYQVKAYKGGAGGLQCRYSGSGHRAIASGRPWFAEIGHTAQ